MEDGCEHGHRRDADVLFAKVGNSIRQCLQPQPHPQGVGAGNAALLIKYQNPSRPAKDDFCTGFEIIFGHREWAKACCVLQSRLLINI